MTSPTYFTCTLGQAAPHRTKDHIFTNINDFIERNAKDYGDLPAAGFCVPNDSGPWKHEVATFADIYSGSCNTAKLISTELTIPAREAVALLCPSTPEFLFTWLALMCLSHPVLLIAPQCSSAITAELCKQCEVSHLFYDGIYEELVQATITDSQYLDRPLRVHLLPFSEVNPFDLARRRIEELPEMYTSEQDDVAYLHHTSGTSSGIPKPIPQTHNAGVGVYARFDGSQHGTFTTTPLYHGGIADLFRAWTSKALTWLFPGKDIPTTATNVVRCLETAAKAAMPPVKYFSSVSYVLQMMATHDKGLEQLRNMDIVGVGGAALPAEAGDTLVRKGVNLISRFGSAECGFLMSSHREYGEDKEWQYLRQDSDLLRFEKQEDGLSELVILPGWPHMSKTNREDGSFATSDLFEPHPGIPNAWRYHSRADSQLTLITGKKFDPAPLEDAIAANVGDLQNVLVFGNGKPYPGALLFLSQNASEKVDKDVLRAIIPKVEKLNWEGQSHTRLSANMLFVMPYDPVALDKSSKGTVLRKKAEERYAAQIEAAYDVTCGAENVPDAEVEERVLAIVRSITSSSTRSSGELGIDMDLFAYGVDSVACVQIRRAVSKLLPEGAIELPLTIVQDAGSVHRLSNLVVDLRNGRAIDNKDKTDHSQSMRDLVDQYSQINDDLKDAEKLAPSPSRSPGKRCQTVLLTGATGSLGSHVLSQLAESSEVSHIHVLLRGATQRAAKERIRKSLESKELEIPPGSASKITVHVCSFSKPHLELSEEAYKTLVQEVDMIYHLAWSVDFTIPLSAFTQHFAGLQAPLSMSLQHARYAGEPARLIFCSSTASVASYSAGKAVPETIIEDPEVSSSIGYSSSKWVAENICAKATKTHPRLDARIIRVGQLSGDSIRGIWNVSEAYPLLLSSLKATGCLPDLPNESVSWVPVDVAASAFLELGRSESPKQDIEVQVFHLLSQDTSTKLGTLLQWLRKEEVFEVVKPQDWLERLEELSRNGNETNPSLKLLDFWKRAYGGNADSQQADWALEYKVEKSFQAMPVLSQLQPVDEEYALKLWSWISNNV